MRAHKEKENPLFTTYSFLVLALKVALSKINAYYLKSISELFMLTIFNNLFPQRKSILFRAIWQEKDTGGGLPPSIHVIHFSVSSKL
jgi:hypothetical protein